MDINFIIKEAKELLNKTTLNICGEPKIYEFWRVNVSELGTIYFVSFLIDSIDIIKYGCINRQIKTIGLCYKTIKKCILPELCNVTDISNRNLCLYDPFINNIIENHFNKYIATYNNLKIVRFDEYKILNTADQKFDKKKIEEIITENIYRKYCDLVIKTTLPIMDSYIKITGNNISDVIKEKIKNELKDFKFNANINTLQIIESNNIKLNYEKFMKDIEIIPDDIFTHDCSEDKYELGCLCDKKPNNSKTNIDNNFDNRVTVGIIPPDVKIKKIDFINSVEDIPTQKFKGYDIETGGLDDIFEIKTNIYR